GFMFGTVTSAELKTRTLTSLRDGCAACTAAMEIQDNKIRRRLICVFICFSLSESEAFNPNRGKGRGSGVQARVEGRVSRGNRSSRNTRPSSLDTRHSIRSSAAAEILIHHLLLLPPSPFFLFFNPDP